jgi:hypothetical protein
MQEILFLFLFEQSSAAGFSQIAGEVFLVYIV